MTQKPEPPPVADVLDYLRGTHDALGILIGVLLRRAVIDAADIAGDLRGHIDAWQRHGLQCRIEPLAQLAHSIVVIERAVRDARARTVPAPPGIQ